MKDSRRKDDSMKRKVAIVTGANSGMGKATTVELMKKDYMVIMACRNKKRGLRALKEVHLLAGGKGKVKLMHCDLASLAQLSVFCQRIHERYDSIDCLINNAGVITMKREETEDGFEKQFGVNHLGHVYLVHQLMDLLLNSHQGRIVIVASHAHKAGHVHFDDLQLRKHFSPMMAYSQSKCANIMYTYALERRLRQTPVTVNCVHPGAVATQMGVNRKTGFGKGVMKLLSYVFLTPRQGADTAIELATSPSYLGISGNYFYKRERVPSSAFTMKIDACERLYYKSLELVGVTESIH